MYIPFTKLYSLYQKKMIYKKGIYWLYEKASNPLVIVEGDLYNEYRVVYLINPCAETSIDQAPEPPVCNTLCILEKHWLAPAQDRKDPRID
jgi:hypothetical protein